MLCRGDLLATLEKVCRFHCTKGTIRVHLGGDKTVFFCVVEKTSDVFVPIENCQGLLPGTRLPRGFTLRPTEELEHAELIGWHTLVKKIVEHFGPKKRVRAKEKPWLELGWRVKRSWELADGTVRRLFECTHPDCDYVTNNHYEAEHRHQCKQ